MSTGRRVLGPWPGANRHSMLHLCNSEVSSDEGPMLVKETARFVRGYHVAGKQKPLWAL